MNRKAVPKKIKRLTKARASARTFSPLVKKKFDVIEKRLDRIEGRLAMIHDALAAGASRTSLTLRMISKIQAALLQASGITSVVIDD